MSDDGTGSGIRIPAVLISKADGEKLRNFLINKPKELANQAALSVEFTMQNANDKTVKYEIWYTSANDKALDFIKNFKDDHISLADDVEFEPRIVTWACPKCDSEF